jgi:hypothetical protein
MKTSLHPNIKIKEYNELGLYPSATGSGPLELVREIVIINQVC